MKNKNVKKKIIHCPWETNKEVARTQISQARQIFFFDNNSFFNEMVTEN